MSKSAELEALLERARNLNVELGKAGIEIGLAAGGMAPPPVGTAVDAVSLARDTWGAVTGTGSWWDVAFSAAGFIPILGDGAKAGKVIAKTGKLADEAAEIASELAKYGDEGTAAIGELRSTLGGLRKVGCDTLGIKQICGALQSMQPKPKGGRLGNEATRQQNAEIANELERRGFEITGGGGRFPEEYLPPAGGGRKGGTYVDVTAVRDGKTVRVQTVDTRADGLTPSTRESAAAARIRAQQHPRDHTVLIPKKRAE